MDDVIYSTAVNDHSSWSRTEYTFGLECAHIPTHNETVYIHGNKSKKTLFGVRPYTCVYIRFCVFTEQPYNIHDCAMVVFFIRWGLARSILRHSWYSRFRAIYGQFCWNMERHIIRIAGEKISLFYDFFEKLIIFSLFSKISRFFWLFFFENIFSDLFLRKWIIFSRNWSFFKVIVIRLFLIFNIKHFKCENKLHSQLEMYN